MSIVIQHAGDPWFRPCETCRGTGEVEAGHGDCAGREWCDDCSGHGEVAHDLSPLAALAHNLAIAAALQLVYIVSAGNSAWVGHPDFPWVPGCGREIPKPRHPHRSQKAGERG